MNWHCRNKVSISCQILILCLIIIFLENCNAPRSNPLDPKNDTDLKILTGQVFSLSYKPLDHVKVIWLLDGKITFTDDKGKFTLGPVDKKSGYLYFEKEGYAGDSLFVDWENPEIPDPVLLNSVPYLDSLEFYSVVDNYTERYKQKKLVVCKVKLSDDDNNITSVFLIKEGKTKQDSLIYNPASKYFERTFSVSELNETSLEQLIGKDFHFWVVDQDNAKFNIGRYHIKRIISQEVQLESPGDLDTVSVPFKLNWDRFLPGFDFEYKVQIHTNYISNNVLVWEKIVPSDSISVTITENIPSGSYTWVIWSIDRFLNRNASKGKSFIVE